MKKENRWVLIALLWLCISVGSLFVGVISYTPPDGTRVTYAIGDLLRDDRFSQEVLRQYTGSFRLEIAPWVLTALCVLAVCAIAAALIGLLILSKQRSLRWPLVMTAVGAVGTAIPALIVLCASLLSASYFPGTITPGYYPIITPPSVALCLFLVAREQRRIKKAAAAAKENVYIHAAGDL